MENATKALLIAAAVLISILIISLGLIIYQNASGAMEGADLSEAQIVAFNDKFLQYEGDNVSGAKVNAMITTVFNNNLSQDDDGKKVAITGDITLAKDATSKGTAKADTGETYEVVLTYSTTSGLVTSIAVTKNT